MIIVAFYRFQLGAADSKMLNNKELLVLNKFAQRTEMQVLNYAAGWNKSKLMST
jgi:hypothetical protein